MQILHHADLASKAAARRPNLANDKPSADPILDRSAGPSSGRDLEMKICVLGAGVIGLTTAWCLAEAGHDVVIIDRHASTAKDASAANGAQLSYAFVAPLASPAALKKLP
jgi:NADPH-dependent 2,4-dienoyl-CoA reductase/sulfur reductase-like enzyme